MQTWARYASLLVIVAGCLHLILQTTHQGYKDSTSLSALRSQIQNKWKSDKTNQSEDIYFEVNATLPQPTLANATFVILARNSDLKGTIQSINYIEQRFNGKHGGVLAISKSKMEFGIIPKDDWYQPDWIDEVRATEGREKMVMADIIYGGSVSYRNMCRFNSGFFFKHELMQKYRWYWRIEPDVQFWCDINFDPFIYMRDNHKVYGFTISLYEFEATIPTLWGHVKDFMDRYPQYVAKDNAMKFLSNDEGKTYNLCHFWSNFEIADMDFWRGEAYTAFFEYLDSKGGFYYERWGDAPVHSIAAALFLPKEKIHFFNEIAYEHSPFMHCPGDFNMREELKCACPGMSFDYHGYSCLSQWHLANLP